MEYAQTMSLGRSLVMAAATLCGCGGGSDGAGMPPTVGQFPGQDWDGIELATASRRPFVGIEAASEIGWVRRTPEPPPAGAPAFYHNEAIGFDSTRNVVYKFGGRHFEQLSNELWSWDPVSGEFSLLGGSLDGPQLQGWPAGGDGLQLVEDRARSVMLLTSGPTFWAFDGDDFAEHPRDTQDAATGVGVLSAYDTQRERVAVFGSTNGRIWWYDPTTHQYEPAGRIPLYEPGTAMVYHEARDTYLIAATGNSIGEWDPNDNSWADLTPLRDDEEPSDTSDPYDACVESLVYLPAKERVFTHCYNNYARDYEIDVATNTWYSTLGTSQEYPGDASVGQPLTYDSVRDMIIAIAPAGVERAGAWERPQ